MSKNKSELTSLSRAVRRHYEKAFPLQQQLIEVFGQALPIAQDGIARAADAAVRMEQYVSGDRQALTILQDLVDELNITLEAQRQMQAAKDAAALETSEGIEAAGVALMKLREFEDAPTEIAQHTILIAQIMENAELIASNHAGTLAVILAKATANSRREAAVALPPKLVDEWINDLIAARATPPLGSDD